MHRVLTRLLNTPLAISQAKLDVITSNVSMKLLAGEELQRRYENVNSGMEEMYILRAEEYLSSLNVIKVFDSLVSKNGAGASGCTSYEKITSDINIAIAKGFTTLYFYIDSPGGEVSGLFGLAEYIFSLRDKGITTIGITDGSMTSAAYVLGSACEKLYATSSSIVASIGVIMSLVDRSEHNKEEGISYTILRSKDEKALYSGVEPISDKVIEDSIKMLSTLDNIMNEVVIKYRTSLSLETIMNLKGNIVLGEEALNLNLIDGIVLSATDVITTEVQPSNKIMGETMNENELQAEVIRLSTENTKLKAEQNLAITKATQAEQVRILGIIEASTTFSIPLSSAVKFISQGSTIDNALASFEAIKEVTQAANHVNTGNILNHTVKAQDFKEETSPLSDLISAMTAPVSTPATRKII